MRTTLMIAAPQIKNFQAGASTAALTEFIDIYPTLCDLTDISPPDHLQGKSITPVLKNPTTTHREAAIGRYQSGDTIRTDRFRYTLYRSKQKVIGQMLYDHHTDPQENQNLAENPSG